MKSLFLGLFFSFTSYAAIASPMCKEVLAEYKPKQIFYEAELEAYHEIASALLAVRMFKGDIKGIERSTTRDARFTDYSLIDTNSIAKIVISDLDTLFKQGRVSGVPITSFLKDGYKSKSKFRFPVPGVVKKALSSLSLTRKSLENTKYSIDYLETRYIDDEQKNDTEKEIHEFIKADINNIINQALFMETEHKLFTLAKSLLVSLPTGAGLQGSLLYLNNPYSINPVDIVVAGTVLGVIGSTGYMINRFRRGLFTPAPVHYSNQNTNSAPLSAHIIEKFAATSSSKE